MTAKYLEPKGNNISSKVSQFNYLSIIKCIYSGDKCLYGLGLKFNYRR